MKTSDKQLLMTLSFTIHPHDVDLVSFLALFMVMLLTIVSDHLWLLNLVPLH